MLDRVLTFGTCLGVLPRSWMLEPKLAARRFCSAFAVQMHLFVTSESLVCPPHCLHVTGAASQRSLAATYVCSQLHAATCMRAATLMQASRPVIGAPPTLRGLQQYRTSVILPKRSPEQTALLVFSQPKTSWMPAGNRCPPAAGTLSLPPQGPRELCRPPALGVLLQHGLEVGHGLRSQRSWTRSLPSAP